MDTSPHVSSAPRQDAGCDQVPRSPRPQFPFPAADRIRMDVIELTDVLDTMPASARGLSSGKESFLLLGKPLKKIPSVLSEQIHHCQEVVCRAQSPPRYIHFTHDNAEYGVSEIVARDSWVACAILPDASTSPTITLSMMSRRSWHTTVGSRAIPQCIHFTHDNAEYDVSEIVALDSCVSCAIPPDAFTSPTITLSMMSRRSWHATVVVWQRWDM